MVPRAIFSRLQQKMKGLVEKKRERGRERVREKDREGETYSGIRAKTTKTEDSFFVSKYGLIVLIFDIYDYL